MSEINEGQTQVYMNSGVTPQYGVNTNAPHLNNPPQQLLDIIGPLVKSGKSDAQLLSILVGMGIEQQLALAGIQKCRQMTPFVQENSKSEKNHKQMKFTLIDLYEKINTAISSLDEMSSDSGRLSYSSKMAKNEFNGVLNKFPNDLVVNLGEGTVALSFNEGKELTEYKEKIEESINPSLKYKLIGEAFNAANKFSWISPAGEFIGWCNDIYESNKWSFSVVNAIFNIRQNDTLHESLRNSLYGILDTPNEEITESIKSIASKNPWSREVSNLVYTIQESEKQSSNQSAVSVSRVITPFLIEENGTVVNINGVNFMINESEVKQVEVNNAVYNTILESLNMASIKNETITFYGQRDKALTFNMNEGTLKLGGLDLSEKSVMEIRQALMTERFYHYAESNKIDKICMFLENIDSITEMDNVLSLSSAEFAGLYLTLINVNEGVYIHKVNTGMKVNEFKLIESAQSALSEVKEFIGYDASNYLSEKLIAEGNQQAIVTKKREELNNTISFLEEKRTQILEAIKSSGETEELVQAKELIESEIQKFEKELSETYSVNEKKLSKSEIDQYANDGFVPAILNKTLDKDFKKGEEIMVNAEEYSSLGKGDLLKIVNPSNGKDKMVDKGDLNIDITGA